MKKIMKMMLGGFLVFGLIISNISMVSVYASSSDTGAIGALQDKEFTLNEMLEYAIEDEYLAQTEYDLIMKEFNVTRPFSNIIKSEGTHISLLEPLFDKYNVVIPNKDWESLLEVPSSLNEAYEVGVEAEIKNIAMYELFLKQDLPDDVRIVFERLKSASENHLRSFERQVDRKIGGNFNKNN